MPANLSGTQSPFWNPGIGSPISKKRIFFPNKIDDGEKLFFVGVFSHALICQIANILVPPRGALTLTTAISFFFPFLLALFRVYAVGVGPTLRPQGEKSERERGHYITLEGRQK